MNEPNHVLPPASTTNVNLRAQASGFFAQRRRGANIHETSREEPINEGALLALGALGSVALGGLLGHLAVTLKRAVKDLIKMSKEEGKSRAAQAGWLKLTLKERAQISALLREEGIAVREASHDLYDDPEPVIIRDACQRAPEPEQLAESVEQRYTLTQLVERIQRRRGRRRVVVESGDPDGPDDTGWDPRVVKAPPRGAALAAGILAHQRRTQR